LRGWTEESHDGETARFALRIARIRSIRGEENPKDNVGAGVPHKDHKCEG
jgi:hypothetical protein